MEAPGGKIKEASGFMPGVAENFSFNKSERLCGKKDIDSLMSRGKWGFEGCIKYCWAPGELDHSRIIAAVPKKLFRRAVKRNLLKRRIREAYRLQKSLISTPVDIFFIYNSSEVLPFDTIKSDIAAILRKSLA